MSVALDVPSGGALFEGHFPGRPILAGIAELALVAKALAPVDGAVLGAIPFVRFRGVVLPGDRLDLTSGLREDGATRFEVRRGGERVANGALRFGAQAEEPDASIAVAARRSARASVIESLIPHRPPMRFVERILGEAEDGLTCAARVPRACALVEGGAVPSFVALEAAAQAAAAWEALRRAGAQGAAEPLIGYLVSIGEVVLPCARLPADEEFSVSIRLEAGAGALAGYQVESVLDGEIVLRGRIGTYAPGQSSRNTNH